MAQDLPPSERDCIELDSLDQGSTGSSTPSEIQVGCFYGFHFKLSLQVGQLNAVLATQQHVQSSKGLFVFSCMYNSHYFRQLK